MFWSISQHVAALQEEMEALLGKACKQAVSSLSQMGRELGAEASQKVCGVPITRMLCPGLLHHLHSALACLETIPIMLDRTLQIGRENEFYFEVALLCTFFLMAWHLAWPDGLGCKQTQGQLQILPSTHQLELQMVM